MFRALIAAALLAAQPSPAPSTAPAPAVKAAQPVVIRIGTTAVWSVREPQGTVSAQERGQVVQSRVDQVLLHHPYLTWQDVKLLKEKGEPTIYWGPFPIMTVDAAHARVNNFSSADLLAHAWANNLRAAAKDFFAGKKMPERALYHTEQGDFTYKRTDKTMNQPTQLRNTRYVFSPEDFEYGAGAKDPGQRGLVIFTKKDAAVPPQQVYLGNAQGSFTEFELIKPEDTP
ncbi:MAG: hypothetical protein JWM80_5980 [Cyanobacteria bacterium RYN_339]|nr:hypothetical protein [Cyanobacteria bacterium RYN_339]